MDLLCCVVCRPPVSEGITPLQESLQATRIHDSSLPLVAVPEEEEAVQKWVDIDAPERGNHLYPAVYAEDICQYMKRREVRRNWEWNHRLNLVWDCETELGIELCLLPGSV